MRCIIGVNAHYITFTVHYIYITFTLHMNTFYIATVSTRLILVSGQFGADNSAQDNSSRTIRRKEYNINLLENPALIKKMQQYFSSIPLPIQQYVFINPSSISAILFHQSRFHFSNIFSPILLPSQQYFPSIPLPCQQYLFVI